MCIDFINFCRFSWQRTHMCIYHDLMIPLSGDDELGSSGKYHSIVVIADIQIKRVDTKRFIIMSDIGAV